MKKMIKDISGRIFSLLIALLMSLIGGHVSGQERITVSQPGAATPVNTCGNYPSSGTSVYGPSVLTAGHDCNTTITESSSIVYFTARDKVILYPGFKALRGSKFVARIGSPSRAEEISNESIDQNVTVFPNPFTKNFIATINSEKAGKVQLTIYNSAGAKIKEQAGVNLMKGLNEISFNGLNFPAGIYILEMNFGHSKIVKKITRSD